jgi:hypothetical protein
MRIQILIFILCETGFGSGFLFNADPDPTFHPDVDPDPDLEILASKEKLKLLKKCSNRLIFHTFWLLICKLWVFVEPDPAVLNQFGFLQIRIRIKKP